MNGVKLGLGTILAAAVVVAACSSSSDPESKSKVQGCTVNTDCTIPATTPTDCALAVCSSGACALEAKDTDGDGHASSDCAAVGTAVITTGDDCDDADPAIHPGAWDGPENASTGDPDQCDLKDQDCDGTSDDDAIDGKSCSCDTGTTQLCATDELGQPIPGLDGTKHEVGICKLGTKACEPGQPVKCVGAVGPKPKDCTSPLDNDCNEKIDNTELAFCTCELGQTEPCVSGQLGACANGTKTCQTSGSSSVWGPCVAKPAGSPDCSSASDNDCDGVKDNEQVSCKCSEGAATFSVGTSAACNQHAADGTGPCKAGQKTCNLNGASVGWSACSGDVGPSTEACNPLQDLNCDSKGGNGAGCIQQVYVLVPPNQMLGPCDFTYVQDAMWSLSPNEAGWKQIATLYLYKTAQPGTTPAVRCTNGSKHDSALGSCAPGWSQEQIVGYVKDTQAVGFQQLRSFTLPAAPSTHIIFPNDGGVYAWCQGSTCPEPNCALTSKFNATFL